MRGHLDNQEIQLVESYEMNSNTTGGGQFFWKPNNRAAVCDNGCEASCSCAAPYEISQQQQQQEEPPLSVPSHIVFSSSTSSTREGSTANLRRLSTSASGVTNNNTQPRNANSTARPSCRSTASKNSGSLSRGLELLNRQEQFLAFCKILLKHLEKSDEVALLKVCKTILRDCVRKNQQGKLEDGRPLYEVAEAQMLTAVGPRHWNRSVQYLNLYLKKLHQRHLQQLERQREEELILQQEALEAQEEEVAVFAI